MEERILIVDDEQEIREMLSRHFRYMGYEVETAENGKEALKVFETKKIDVVISDILMPDMDGVELLRQVRQEYPMVKVIVITGYVTLENILACMRHGAETCVYKPLDDMSELDEAVKDAVESMRRWKRKCLELRGMRQ
jgi:DNA-binding NtrC family response regulator